MQRIHLFEFEDQKWFPSFLRNYMTDFLQFLSNKAKIYEPIIPLLVEKLKATNSNKILDLASGGGGGLLWLNKELLKHLPELKIILTDYYPNISAFKFTKTRNDNFEFITKSIDARNVPKNLNGFRTQFLSFHHFKPKDAQEILQNAVDSKASIAIFEAQDRTLPSFLGMLFSPLSVLITTPFIKPFKIRRLIFTYLIPIVPICVLWDGIVSCLRTYSVSEMENLVKLLENREQFDWEIGVKKKKTKKVLYLIGIPTLQSK